MRGIGARLDSAAAGFPLQVYVAVTLDRHDDAAHRRFGEAVRAMPEVIAADWVTGETDAMLMVVAREVAELQRVLVRLSTRGGAAAGDDAAAAGGAQARLAAAAGGGPGNDVGPRLPLRRRGKAGAGEGGAGYQAEMPRPRGVGRGRSRTTGTE